MIQTKRRPGRPSLSPEGNMVRLEINLRPGQRDLLVRMVAEGKGGSCSEIVRELLDRHLTATEGRD